MKHAHPSVEPAKSPSDPELLDRFFSNGDDGAFSRLVEKYAPLVMGICQRVLRDRQESEDCFQRVFLLLARKGKSIRRHDSLPGWLFTVAHREAIRRLRQLNRRATTSLENEPMEPASGTVTVEDREAARLLQEEVSRLPATYRGPIVLCYLEGKSREETAQELGSTDASIKARLTRGREILRKRLLKRGIVYGTAIAAWQSTSTLYAGSVSAVLIAQTVTVSTSSTALVSTGLMGSSPMTSFNSGVLKFMALSNSSKMGIGIGVIALALLGISTALLMSNSKDAPLPGNSPPTVVRTNPIEEKSVLAVNRPAPIDYDQLQPYHAAAARFIGAIESQDYDRAIELMEFAVVEESDRYWESEEFLESYKESLARTWLAIPEWPLLFSHAFVGEDRALVFSVEKTLRLGNRTVKKATFEIPCIRNEAGEWRVQGIHMESPDVPTDHDSVVRFMQRYPTAERIDLSHHFQPGIGPSAE